jgi:hypothetical protein
VGVLYLSTWSSPDNFISSLEYNRKTMPLWRGFNVFRFLLFGIQHFYVPCFNFLKSFVAGWIKWQSRCVKGGWKLLLGLPGLDFSE